MYGIDLHQVYSLLFFPSSYRSTYSWQFLAPLEIVCALFQSSQHMKRGPRFHQRAARI